MKIKLAKSLGLLLGLLGGFSAFSQSAINSAGGSRVIAGNTHSWSVGEMTVVNTATAGNITVTHGVLQPDGGPTAVSKTTLPGLFEVFPNPATDAIRFRYQFPQAGTLQCTLIDATGKRVFSNHYSALSGGGSETLPLQNLAVGTYLLDIQFTDVNKVISTTAYTIQKIR